jgi:hypothetical protein
MTATTKFGNSATFNHPNADKVYNRETGKTTEGSPTVLPTSIGGPIGVSPRLVNGDTIQESDQIIYVEESRLTFTIEPGETTVTIDGKTFAITEVKPFRTQDVDVAFRLVIR